MIRELIAIDDDLTVGIAVHDAKGRISFEYSQEWLTDSRFPLSISIPLVAGSHKDSEVRPFLQGLLPDNENILRAWAKIHHVSHQNPFGLIAYRGEELAGAVQFVRPDRLATVRTGPPTPIEWLDEKAVAERLAGLRKDNSAWRSPSDPGPFSLAGAQPKTTYLYDESRPTKKWGIPSGRQATTHILKPPIEGFDGHAENEHFCMQLARKCGLPTADSEVRRFEGEIAIVVKRYDRIVDGGKVRRIHQEDLCQALGYPPRLKYQSDGGPTPKQIIELLRKASTNPVEDVQTFTSALGFNWLIGGIDAHAKNYSLLHGTDSKVRLAPLYDIASALPYKVYHVRKIQSAMKIGNQYRMFYIASDHWKKLAKDTGQSADDVIATLRKMADALPDYAAGTAKALHAGGLKDPIITKLSAQIAKRARALRTVL
jgi:serine/threonine-protein kinase HipA